MKLRFATYFVLLGMLTTFGCKSAYEQLRSSNDPVKTLDGANAYFEDENYQKAQSLYELVIPFYRGKKEAEDVFYRYAYTYYHLDQYILASHYFENFTKTFYNSTKKEEMAFMSAYANYRMSPNYKLDQEPSETALEKLQYFINTYPNSTRIEECNALMDELRLKLEDKSYHQGKLYYDLKNYQAAMTSLQNTLKDFPETKRSEELRFLILKSSEELAKNSIYEKMENRLEDAIDKSEKYLAKYPDSKNKKEVNDIIRYCHNELKRFQ